MSRHDGVSCDSCLKSNFRGKRYKCLICYDYDLCATCYEAGATTTRHTTDHPVQCILTRSDVDVFFGGEALTADQPQAFTCPYCSKMGYTEALLQEHVTGEHADTSNEVVCPICASLPGGDPNHVTDDLAAHLTLEHRAPREIDEQHTGIRHVRRIPHPGRGGARTRRTTNMHFSSGGSTLTGLSPSGRENMDPIAELLSQLSSVRSRAAAAQSVSSQLQQLEMQLQTTRQQLERLPRRPAEASKTAGASTAAPTSTEPQGGSATAGSAGTSNPNSLFLLSRCVDSVINESETDLQQDKLARSLFVQETLLSSLTEHLNIGDEGSETFDNLIANVTPLRKENKEPNQKEENVDEPTENVSASASSKSASEAPATKSVQKHVEKGGGGTKQKSSVSNVGLPVNRGGGQFSRVSRQGTGVYQNTGHSQQYRQGGGTVMQHNVDLANLSMNVAVGGGGGANYDTENPQPLPGRPGSGGRDGRLNPPTAKRNMVKHLPTSKTSDREPPPH